MSRPSRVAFTLVEMLVVIAIIGIMISLLLPAVQAARESARRTHCKNNLMQLGLALQNYHSVHGALPAGVRDGAGPVLNVPKGMHYGWLTQVLPYLEQENTYSRIDFEAGVYDKANIPVRLLYLSAFSCPSFRSDSAKGASDYAGCHHDLEAPIDADNHGVLFLNSTVRNDEITDGRSHTLFVGEKLLTQTDMERYSQWDLSTGIVGEPLPADVVPPFEVPPMPTPPPSDLGWMSGTRATLRNTGVPINERLRREKAVPAGTSMPETAAQTGDPTLYVGGFESLHHGGAQFAFGDCSVRLLSEHISGKVYQQLAHRADGQLLDDSSY